MPVYSWLLKIGKVNLHVSISVLSCSGGTTARGVKCWASCMDIDSPGPWEMAGDSPADGSLGKGGTCQKVHMSWTVREDTVSVTRRVPRLARPVRNLTGLTLFVFLTFKMSFYLKKCW